MFDRELNTPLTVEILLCFHGLSMFSFGSLICFYGNSVLRLPIQVYIYITAIIIIIRRKDELHIYKKCTMLSFLNRITTY